MTEDQKRWTCKFCHKSFSHNYKYKIHLSRCLVYTDKTEKEYDVMVELKQELTQELKQTFMDMLAEIKTDLTHQVNQQPMKRLINPF